MAKNTTTAAVVTIPAPKVSTPARKKTGSPAAEAKKLQDTLEAVARDLSTEELVKRLTSVRTGETKAMEQTEHFRNMFEAAKVEASNQRVLLARTAYLLATHPEVATKRYPLNNSGAAKVAAGPDAAAKDVEALRKWITTHTAAGAALAAKKLVFNTAAPTEGERAIVEKVHDETVRADSAKKNSKVREAAAKGKGKSTGTDKGTDEGGIVPPKVETVIPTAEGLLAALETTLQNFRKFNADARLTKVQVSAAEDLLTAIMGELAPETALEVADAEDA